MKTTSRLWTVDEALAVFAAAAAGRPRGEEVVPLERSLDRIVARDLLAPEDLPAFHRSTVDGFAVRAEDVRAATPDHPAVLDLVGEVRMGEVAPFSLGPGETARIPTGGVLPGGSDAVVMQEYCAQADGRVRVFRPVGAWENVIRRGQDIERGTLAVPAGTRVRPQEMSLLAGLGITEVPVYLPPRVAIFSTGDEVVPPECRPRPGQVRDMNSYGLTGQVARLGGVPKPGGILPDEEGTLTSALAEAVRSSEMVLVSGGSSVGSADLLDRVIPRLGPPGVIVHGVAIKPGKPTILAVCDGRAVVGLPGHPVSAMVVFDVLVRPVLEAMLGLRPELRGARRMLARLGRTLEAPPDRDEFVRVAVRWDADGPVAEPILGLSGMITTMTRADGYVRVPMGSVVAEGSTVRVSLFD